MKVHLSFNTEDSQQKVHLVSGDRWTHSFLREGSYPSFFGEREEKTEKNFRVVKWQDPTPPQRMGRFDKVKDVQWLDVKALEGTAVQARIAEVVSLARAAGEKCPWEETLVDFDTLAQCFGEITGTGLSVGMPAQKLCQLMLSRTVKALQFKDAYIKPYTTYEEDGGEDDVGYVRIREGESLISQENVDSTLQTLAAAKNWFLRHQFSPKQSGEGFDRQQVEDSNPYKSGLVHFRVRGFVDQPKANMLELVFTYIHEVSHCWANARDNRSKLNGRSMYIRKWVTGPQSTTVQRAKEDPAQLLTCADFMAYTILRRAGMIQPDFLQREGWRDS